MHANRKPLHPLLGFQMSQKVCSSFITDLLVPFVSESDLQQLFLTFGYAMITTIHNSCGYCQPNLQA